jgi:hypothetical protein
MADIGTESPPSRDKAILNLNDFHSGSIKPKVPSVASIITDATSLLYGFSQSMSEDGISHSMSEEDFTNETKHFLSQCGVPTDETRDSRWINPNRQATSEIIIHCVLCTTVFILFNSS